MPSARHSSRCGAACTTGIEPLLALLGSKSARAKENAVSAIVQLTYRSAEIQAEIASRGGIPLVASVLISSTTNAKQMMAAASLCSLAGRAMAQLCQGGKENQAAFAEAAAIPPLISMLSSPSAPMQAASAGAAQSHAHSLADCTLIAC